MTSRITSENVTNPLRRALRFFAPAQPRLKLKPALASVPGMTPKENRILIVDDDAVIRKTSALKLEAYGYNVVTASDGPTAIQAARTQKPDLILLDLCLPSDVGAVVWDGFLLMGWLQRLQETKDIPIIVITSGDPERYKFESLTKGAVGFFPKPLDHRKLASVIERAVRKEAADLGPGEIVEFEV
jgi:CheY-like chemotaxis protein